MHIFQKLPTASDRNQLQYKGNALTQVPEKKRGASWTLDHCSFVHPVADVIFFQLDKSPVPT